MNNNEILIRGAGEHNLKNINLNIPRNTFIVITGLSGSGKSSLAFDTIYAEGQRRYVESLSVYARQFLGKLQKPKVEHIEGLSPAIAIEQRSSSGTPRSIVGTQTEIYDYLRLLYARIGIPHCWKCGLPVKSESPQSIIDSILLKFRGRRINLLAPVIRGKKGNFNELFGRLRKDGFTKVRVDKKVYSLEEDIFLARYKQHEIEVVIDRLLVKEVSRMRLSDSVESGLKLGKGEILVKEEDKDEIFSYNTMFSCPKCKTGISELEPRSFSFNSPYGACPKCKGLGVKLEFAPDLIIPDEEKTLREGAIEAWKCGGKGLAFYYRSLLTRLSKELEFSLDTPFKKLSKDIKSAVLYGADVYIWGRRFEGVVPNLERLFNTSDSEYRKNEIAKYISKKPCPLCGGKRLKKESLAVVIKDRSIWDIMLMPLSESYAFFDKLILAGREKAIAYDVVKEIKNRLKFCLEVGLGYLTLDRLSSTLSGGEAQRIRLATQVGSALAGVIYILDEPTIGLHQFDNIRLIKIFEHLRDLGNTVIVVEHDESIIRASDWVVDLGPGAGKTGGRVVYSGPSKEIPSSTLTGKYLKGEKYIPLPLQRRDYKKNPFVLIKNARQFNLKKIDVKIPLGVFVGVTGVSGSGKSTLVNEILYKALAKFLYGAVEKPGLHSGIKGKDLIDKVVIVDQSPIGRTPRSNPATYTGVFTPIRELFSLLPESRRRGFTPSRFSFNLSGGRCESCRGEGLKKIDMHFLPPVYINCQECRGKRFNKPTLEVKFKGYSIADVLSMTVNEAAGIFSRLPRIAGILNTLQDVGLGYIQLGQPATTLSGGEAQRMKIAKYLRMKPGSRTMYILDEPTTGLHFDDVMKLLQVLQRLVDKGNTVLVIEHNLDVIKCADYLIDLGPEGGNDGGYLVAKGSPEEVIKESKSYTAKFLKEKLKNSV